MWVAMQAKAEQKTKATTCTTRDGGLATGEDFKTKQHAMRHVEMNHKLNSEGLQQSENRCRDRDYSTNSCMTRGRFTCRLLQIRSTKLGPKVALGVKRDRENFPMQVEVDFRHRLINLLHNTP